MVTVPAVNGIRRERIDPRPSMTSILRAQLEGGFVNAGELVLPNDQIVLRGGGHFQGDRSVVSPLRIMATWHDRCG
jgi:hypothetical protein